MTDRPPVVSIVMVTRNEIVNLRRSFPALLGQAVDIPFEIVVIDSGSTDGTVEFVEGHANTDARIRLVQIAPGEFHHARTRNLGAELATGRYVVFLGGDAVPVDSGWLAELLEPLRRDDDPLIAASYSRQIPRAGADVVAVCRIGYNYGAEPRIKGRDLRMSQKERYFLSTVSCCIDLERVARPLFDPTHPVDEDITLSRRIIDAGLRIAYRPGSAVEHSHDFSGWDLVRRYYDNAVIYKRLGIFGPDGSSISGDGRRYLASSMTVLRRRGAIDLGRFLYAFGCSAIGLQLGLHHRWLPSPVRRVLSVYGTTD
ncbi:MAG: glycosyltransferase family 2 protein [Acidimicrobiales bacterium]